MTPSQTRYACCNHELTAFPEANDPVWAKAPPAELKEVESGKRPFLRTEFQLIRDDKEKAFYLKITAEDDELHSTYRLDDETLYTQDVFELFIAEGGEITTYREIEVSPFDLTFTGTIRITEGGKRHLNMDWEMPGFVTKTRHNELAHQTISIWKMPYAAFNMAPVPGKPWRFNVFRVDHSRRGEELQAWQHTGARNFHVPECFAWLDFIQ
ncbi:MAG: hypothetical protein GXZ04_09045 [Clostridiales bacterium]|nr:hypothetical protein [Clostridiales bacterium]